MNFWQALFHPDREMQEFPERQIVTQAANLLQIGEFQLLQLAYADWFGIEMPAADADRVFRAYMYRSVVPVWARHYARRVLDLEAAGRLHADDPTYHRYDVACGAPLDRRVQRFVVAVVWLVMVLGGGLVWSVYVTRDEAATSVLPPYFQPEELSRPDPAVANPDADG